jgi:hypothetical protein
MRNCFFENFLTELNCAAITLLTHILEVFRSNLDWNTSYPNWCFTWVFSAQEANSGIVSRLGHYRFLPNNFHCLIHPSSSHSMLHSLATHIAVKWSGEVSGSSPPFSRNALRCMYAPRCCIGLLRPCYQSQNAFRNLSTHIPEVEFDPGMAERKLWIVIKKEYQK